MISLSEIVSVARRFQRSIRVDSDRAASAVEGFICTPTAADTLLTMARHVAETGQSAFTVTGSYGAGKSSLAVVLSALLGDNPPARQAARSVLGEELSARLEEMLPAGGERWRILAVNGHVGNPEEAIASALASLERRRTRTRGRHPVDALREMVARGAPVLLIVDEMGKFLEGAATGRGELHFFQLLAEEANRSGGRLLVLGLLHQAFDEYARRLGQNAREEWAKVQGRFVDLPLSLAGEEQVELIARAVECPERPEAARATARRVAEAVARFRPGTSPTLADRLFGCWPLHPVVACLLGPLSRRRFGQNQRSVFAFLNSAEPFGFQEFLRGTDAASSRTYGPEQLWDYLQANLEPSILASPDGHRWSLAVDAVDRCAAKGGTDHLAVVKTVALVDMFKERSGLIPAWNVIAEVFPAMETGRLSQVLDDLQGWSILVHRRHLGAYGLYAGSDFDIEAALSEARAAQTGVDFAALADKAGLQPVLAKRYYHLTGALHWFDVCLTSLRDGVEAVRAAASSACSGRFLLLVQRGEGRDEAESLWREAVAAARDRPVAVGLSTDAAGLVDLTTELLALEAVRHSRPELAGDAVARREILARIARVASDVEETARRALSTARWSWWERQSSGEARTVERVAVDGGLSAVASGLAEARYPDAPHLHNELLNRTRPSTNAVAAQKALLKAMVTAVGKPRLGIVGYPAEGGLLVSLLERTGLYASGTDGRLCFVDPPAAAQGLSQMWRGADTLFQGGGSDGATLADLYALWRAPPFGVRDGLLPVLAVAYLLARLPRMAVYLDGVFQPEVGDFFVDRLVQDPGSVRLRWAETSGFSAVILQGLSDAVGELGIGACRSEQPSPLEIARAIVAFADRLPPWVMRTATLSRVAARVRDLAKHARDPNKFLLDDIPAALGGGRDQTQEAASAVVALAAQGLREMAAAYGAMLAEFEAMMLRELRVEGRGPAAWHVLRSRAEVVMGLTGDFRLDAFASRLATYGGREEDVEGIIALVASRPSREWTDREIDRARVDVAELGRAFLRAEGLAHIKGRTSKRLAMAIIVGDPDRPSPIAPEFDVADSQWEEVTSLVDEMLAMIKRRGVQHNVALAAVAELGAALGQGAPDHGKEA